MTCSKLPVEATTYNNNVNTTTKYNYVTTLSRRETQISSQLRESPEKRLFFWALFETALIL